MNLQPTALSNKPRERSNVIRRTKVPLLYLGKHISNSHAYETLNLEHNETEKTVFSVLILKSTIPGRVGAHCVVHVEEQRAANTKTNSFLKRLVDLVEHSKSQTEEYDHQPNAPTCCLSLGVYLPAILARNQIWGSCDDNVA